MSFDTKYYKKSKKNRMIVILISLLIGFGGLYYCLAMEDSAGSDAKQWTIYSDEIKITCDDSGAFEPAKVEWKTGSDVHGLTLSMTSDYVAGATTVVATVTVSGFLYQEGSYSGTIVVSNANGTHTEEHSFSASVAENTDNLAIIIVSILALCFAVYLFVKRK